VIGPFFIPVMTFHLTFLSGLWTIGWIDCTDAWHRRGPTL